MPKITCCAEPFWGVLMPVSHPHYKENWRWQHMIRYLFHLSIKLVKLVETSIPIDPNHIRQVEPGQISRLIGALYFLTVTQYICPINFYSVDSCVFPKYHLFHQGNNFFHWSPSLSHSKYSPMQSILWCEHLFLPGRIHHTTQTSRPGRNDVPLVYSSRSWLTACYGKLDSWSCHEYRSLSAR